MKQITVKCPLCGLQGKVNFSEDLLKNISKGLFSVNINNDMICPHSFMVYIDKNLQIRDYVYADFSVSIPEISLINKLEEDTTQEKGFMDLNLIKINLSSQLLTYTIKSIFLKQKIVLIIDEEFLYPHLTNFFQYITKNSFKIDLSLTNLNDYKKNKKNFRDAMVLQSNQILKNNKNLLNPKKLDIERKIVAKFFLESQQELSYHLLKNEIFKSYELARSISEDLKKEKEMQNNVFEIQKDLEKRYNIKIDNLYLEFLIDIVKNYFELSVPSLVTSFFEY